MICCLTNYVYVHRHIETEITTSLFTIIFTKKIVKSGNKNQMLDTHVHF